MTWTHLRHSQVRLAPGVFDDRRRLNREYLASLREAALLQNHLIEAGIGEQGWHLHPSGETPADRGLDRHWGWETPGSLLRGHFVGHWMSAAAREIAVTGDPHLRATLDAVVEGLERCQRESDGEWAFAIPPTFLRRLAQGRDVWAPQYDLHKTLMGLVDVYLDLGDERALRVAHRAAQPLARSSPRSRYTSTRPMSVLCRSYCGAQTSRPCARRRRKVGGMAKAHSPSLSRWQRSSPSTTASSVARRWGSPVTAISRAAADIQCPTKWPRSSDPGVSQPQCLSSPRSAGVSPEGCRCQPCSPMPASMKWFWRRAASRSEARYSRLSRRRSSNTPGANRTLECPRCVHVMPGPSSQRSISL